MVNSRGQKAKPTFPGGRVVEERQSLSEAAPRRGDAEWFWRVLAAAMVLSVGWVIWIAIQISPQPLVTPAAYEAAAKAKARSAQGLITPAAPLSAQPVPQTAPLVNVEKLKLSDSLDSPVPRAGAEK